MSSVPGKAPALKLPPQVETAHELLLQELGRLLTAESTLARLVLPELLLELQDPELEQVVQEHLEQTRAHVENVKLAFLSLSEPPAGTPALGLDGLRAEHKAAAKRAAPDVRGSVHVSAAMGAEHYEINAYEAAIRLADALDAQEAGRLLRANLEEEVQALEKLGAQADRLAAPS
jgi:ferritin-like metal-binding protein YciE